MSEKDIPELNEILARINGEEPTTPGGGKPSDKSEGTVADGTKVEPPKTEAEAEGTGGTRYAMEDIQGNPLNQDGTLKVEKISSIDEITDEDFTAPTRNVELPKLPKNVDEAIGAKGKPVVIKKNIFEKNWKSHKFPFEESRAILKAALYDTDLIGQTQPTTKPMHWVAIKLDDKSPIVILEVNDGKYNTEIVGWYTLDERNLERIKRQADKNGGELVILSSKDRVGSLSTPLTGLSSGSKNTQNNSLVQENGEKFSLKRDEEYAKAVASGDVEKQNELVKAAAKARDVRGNKTEDSALLGNEDQDKFVDYISRTRRNDYTSQNGEAESGLESILKYYQNNDGKDNSTTNARRLERISAISKEIRERKRRAAEIRQELGAKPNGEVQQREVERYFHKLRSKQIKIHFTDILKNISGQAECSQLLGLKQ